MKAKNIYISIALLAMGLTACQRDEIPSGDGLCTVRMTPRIAQLTRSYTALPDDMHSFEAGIIVDNKDAVCKKAKMTYITGGEPQLLMMLETSHYNVYGYMPYRDGATYTMNNDKSTATINVPDIAGLSNTMATVVRPTTLVIDNDDKGKEKTLPLQMDHLMAKVTPCFYLAEEYADLRSIQIKEVKFILPNTQSRSVVITYDNNNNPLTYSVAWQAPTAAATPDSTIAYATVTPENEKLTTTRNTQQYGACYICPEQSVDGMLMRVTYDVYDKEGEVTRPNVVATNTIKNLGKDSAHKLTAGKEYKLHIRVWPTYIYSLSDNDEDFLLQAD